MSKYPLTEAQRQHVRDYQRLYRQQHPDKTRAWREGYILRKAARLQAAAQQDQQQIDAERGREQ